MAIRICNNVILPNHNGTTGCGNVAVGQDVGLASATGKNNIAIGSGAGFSTTGGFDNFFAGQCAGYFNTTGSSNNFFGYYAGYCNTTGVNNNFFGYYAGACNTTGCYNNFFGRDAGQINTTGIGNNFIGFGTGFWNTTGSFNNYIGFCAGRCNTTGSHNTFIGSRAGFANTFGSNNFFAGQCAGYNNMDGCSNIFIGLCAGFCGVTGTGNVIIGGNAGACIATATNSVIIADGAGNIKLFGDSSNNVGIGTTSPRYQTTGVVAGLTTLTIFNSAAGGGGIELATGTSTTTAATGRLSFVATSNTDGSRTVAAIDSLIQGSTANNQGGSLRFFTKSDNGSISANMILDSSGNLEAKGKLAVGYSDFSGIPTNGAAFAGSVGIGTSSPGYKLDVQTSAGRFQVQNFGAGSVMLYSNGALGYNAATTGHQWQLAGAEQMRLDSSGNLGLGVTPSAWPGQAASYDVFQFGTGAIYNVADAATEVAFNQYIDSGGVRRYITPNNALRYRIGTTEHQWFRSTDPTPTAGNAISFTQAMTLDASGNLLVGKTSTYRAGRLVVAAANVSQTSTTANLHVTTTDAQAADVGGSIGLGGFADTGEETPFAYISGRKENGISGNYAGYLAFATQDSGAGVTERARITSGGDFVVGQLTASRRLEVWGTPLGAGGDATGALAVIGNNNTAFNSSPTAALTLWTRYNSANGTFPMAVVQAGKENANDGDFSGYLSLQTTTAVGNSTEKARITSTGNLGLGVTPGSSNYSGSATVLNVKGNGTNKIGTVIVQSAGTTNATNIELFAADGANEVGLLTKGASTAITFYTGSVPDKRMTLDSSGNLGIGVTPGAKLEVFGSGNIVRYGDGTNTFNVRFQGPNNWDQQLDTAADKFSIRRNSADFVVVDSSGNLGIGTSSPASKLEVYGAFGTSTTGITLTNSTGFSASNIARFDFKLSNSFNGLERVAAIWALNPNAGANNGGALVFGTSANGTSTTPTERMRLDSSGNLGLGVTPSAWTSAALQLNTGMALWSTGVTNARIFGNTYYDGTYKFLGNGRATQYEQDGYHAWYVSTTSNSSGAGAGPISFTQAMTLDAGGRWLLGKTATTGAGEIFQVDAAGISATTYSGKFENTSTNTAYYNVVRWLQGASGSATGYVGTGGSTVGNAAFQNTFVVGTQSSHALVFNTNDTERARITSGGDFGLGTSGNPSFSSGSGLEIQRTGTATIRLDSATFATEFRGLTGGTEIFQLSGGYLDLGTNNAAVVRIHSTNNVTIGTTTDGGYKLEVNGSFAATTKSFVIDHPTKPGMKLQYGSLESPYHGVRLTGEAIINDKTAIVELPDYIKDLCDQDGANIQITNIKHGKIIWVEEVLIAENKFVVGCDHDGSNNSQYRFYWSFTAIRKDIDKLEVEVY